MICSEILDITGVMVMLLYESACFGSFMLSKSGTMWPDDRASGIFPF